MVQIPGSQLTIDDAPLKLQLRTGIASNPGNLRTLLHAPQDGVAASPSCAGQRPADGQWLMPSPVQKRAQQSRMVVEYLRRCNRWNL